MEDLAERLRAARERAGFKTCTAGANHLRIPQQSLSNYELGVSAPNARALRTICRRFKVSADWLLGLPQGPR